MTPALPGDATALARDLSRPLVPRDRYRLDVRSVAVVASPVPGEAVLDLLVDAVPDAGRAAERWQVALPVALADLDPAVAYDALVLTLRAGLEEWWATRGHDPVTRRFGRRLPPP